MEIILTKKTADGKTVEISKAGNYEFAVSIDGKYLLTGTTIPAVVKGRPEITHVLGGKVGLTAEEKNTLSAAYAAEFAAEVEAGEKSDAAYYEYKRNHDRIAAASAAGEVTK